MSAKPSLIVPPDEGDDASDLRAFFRWQFRGTAFPCRMGKKLFDIRLKDLSRAGACGMVEEPFATGDYFFVHLDAHNVIEAEVMWTRRVMIGVRFNRTLTASFVTKLHERASEEAADRQRAG